jgi:hypothetical protein
LFAVRRLIARTFASAEREDETVERVIDVTECDVPHFTVVETIILANERRRHINFLRPCQRNAVLGYVDSVLFGIECDSHSFCTPNNMFDQEFLGYKTVNSGTGPLTKPSTKRAGRIIAGARASGRPSDVFPWEFPAREWIEPAQNLKNMIRNNWTAAAAGGSHVGNA